MCVGVGGRMKLCFPSHPPPPAPFYYSGKPLVLNLRYLGQIKYHSWEMYWMTLLWPGVKVVAVVLIKKMRLYG